MEDKHTGISIRFIEAYDVKADRLLTEADVQAFRQILLRKQAEIECEELEAMWRA